MFTSSNEGLLPTKRDLFCLVDGLVIQDNRAKELGGGIYTSASFLLLKGAEIGRNWAKKGGGIYWKANPGQVDTGALQGATELLNVAQCPGVLDLTVESEMAAYTALNTSYSPATNGFECFCKGTLPEPMCTAGGYNDLVTGKIIRTTVQDWTFTKYYSCSNLIE